MKETVVDPIWRRRLLMFDAVLILVLGWLLWGAFGEEDDPSSGAGSTGSGSTGSGSTGLGNAASDVSAPADPIAPPPR